MATAQDVAAYIGPMCLQLCRMARAAEFPGLAYILELAALKASLREAEAFRAHERDFQPLSKTLLRR